MRRKGLITFEPEENVEDVKRTVSKKRIRYYPLLDEQGRYIGMVLAAQSARSGAAERHPCRPQ